jgi:hypothetical protein
MQKIAEVGNNTRFQNKHLSTVRRRLLPVAAAVGSLVLLVSCGGGGGGGSTPPVVVPPPPVSVAGVADTRTIQAAAGESLLAFRFALVDKPTYPVAIPYTVSGTGLKPGASCADGADFYVAASDGVSVNASSAAIAGTLTIASSTAARQIKVMACPGTATGDKVLSLVWKDSTLNGIAAGTIRGSANTGLANARILNDTGITSCATGSANAQACPQAAFAGQDAESGRDATAAITGAGASRTSAFAFTALSGGDCIQDNVTGLVWEGKTAGAGLRAATNTYTWLNSDSATNGGAAGSVNGGACTGSSACDTQTYAAAVNAAQVCGFSDWRLPTVAELSTLVDSGAASGAAVDAAIANQRAASYWTATPKASQGDTTGAWIVDFATGAVGYTAKGTPAAVRLVRGR